jgi:hypothetical protein
LSPIWETYGIAGSVCNVLTTQFRRKNATKTVGNFQRHFQIATKQEKWHSAAKCLIFIGMKKVNG